MNESSLSPALPRDEIELALCITELNVGGAERNLAQLAQGLLQHGFRPTVYSLGPPPAGDRSLLDELEQAGIAVHCMGGSSPRDSLAVFRRLRRHLLRQRPLLLQTFLFHANLLGRLAAHSAGVPHVVSGIRVAERRHRWHLRLDRWTERLVDQHVCVSQSVADFSIAEAGLDPARIVVIPNAVDLRRFDEAQPLPLAELGLPPGRRAIVYVGRLDPQKRVAWLLDLAPELLERLPTRDLVLVGDGPERAALQRQATRHPLAGRVHFLGTRGDVPSILRASELLVLPSRWEGMPNVVLEAMACGLPVVATDVEGVREVLGPAADSQVAPVDDPATFAERCRAILTEEGLAQRLGEANRSRLEGHFTLERMVAAYAELYRTLIER